MTNKARTTAIWVKVLIALALIGILIAAIVIPLKAGPSANNYGERAFKPSGRELAESNCMEKENAPKPGHKDAGYPIKPGTIFVSVPAYRDDECQHTITDIFHKAKYPERIYVGVVQQIKFKHENCFNDCDECKRRIETGQIKVIEYDFSEARGPCQARHQASTMWSGQEYYMQIDSHTNFEPDWDVTLMEELALTRDPKAIIGSYPPTDTQIAEIKQSKFKKTPMMCGGGKFTKEGLPKISATLVEIPDDHKRSILVPFVGANLMVMPYQALFDCPFDPYLSFLFFGEEILLSARLWTSGYNFYAPRKSFCSHHYGREGKPKFSSDIPGFGRCKKLVAERVKYITRINTDPELVHPDYRREVELYGLGKERSIEDFWKFAGVDFDLKRVVPNCSVTAYEEAIKLTNVSK
nr:glycosyltransferase [Sicyoidochytrium minutum DNA virus]